MPSIEEGARKLAKITIVIHCYGFGTGPTCMCTRSNVESPRVAGGAGGGVGTHAASGPGTQARPDTRLSPASAPRSRRASSRARACPRRCAAAAMALDLKLVVVVEAALGGAPARVPPAYTSHFEPPWPPGRQPGPSGTQRSGKRRHLRQQEAENLSGDPLPGSRGVPPVALPPPGLAGGRAAPRECVRFA